MGESFFCVRDEYRWLLKEMLSYAQANFSKDDEYKALISDSDGEFQNIAADLGYVPTQEKEVDAYFPIDASKVTYEVPEGFTVSDMHESYDVYKYGEVLWKGFNHEMNGEGKYNPDENKLRALHAEMKRPNVDLSLKIMVIAPNGDFVSYCGMWKDEHSQTALVEPVATAPEYRKRGLGKAAVLEGIRRCGRLGAKTAFVGSSQQFYYNIGFRPYGNATWWKRRT
jgi:predicted N-acetyltransferase YhbS